MKGTLRVDQMQSDAIRWQSDGPHLMKGTLRVDQMQSDGNQMAIRWQSYGNQMALT